MEWFKAIAGSPHCTYATTLAVVQMAADACNVIALTEEMRSGKQMDVEATQ